MLLVRPKLSILHQYKPLLSLISFNLRFLLIHEEAAWRRLMQKRNNHASLVHSNVHVCLSQSQWSRDGSTINDTDIVGSRCTLHLTFFSEIPLPCFSKADLSVTYASTEYLENPFIAAQCSYYRWHVSVYPVTLQSTLYGGA